MKKIYILLLIFLFDIVIWGFLCLLVFFIIEKVKEKRKK